jgi:acetyl-CoA carboxylase biotin carboxyl carrier protein
MMGRFDVDPALVRRLAELLDETGLTEIEYQSGTQRIRVARTPQGQIAVAPAAAAAVTPVGAPPAAASEGPPAGAVVSPMVGTAYVAPEPGARAFVNVGDRVVVGQTLLIIEAMKVMNPITAPHGGMVTDVFVSDGRPVEFGEVLMVIR